MKQEPTQFLFRDLPAKKSRPVVLTYTSPLPRNMTKWSPFSRLLPNCSCRKIWYDNTIRLVASETPYWQHCRPEIMEFHRRELQNTFITRRRRHIHWMGQGHAKRPRCCGYWKDRTSQRWENYHSRQTARSLSWLSRPFRLSTAEELAPRRTFDHAVDIKPDQQPPWGPIYPLLEKQLKALRTYLDDMLAQGKI